MRCTTAINMSLCFFCSLMVNLFSVNAFLSWFIVISLFDPTSPSLVCIVKNTAQLSSFGCLPKFGFVDILSSAPVCSLKPWKKIQHNIHTLRTLFSPCLTYGSLTLCINAFGHYQQQGKKGDGFRDVDDVDDQHSSIPFQS